MYMNHLYTIPVAGKINRCMPRPLAKADPHQGAINGITNVFRDTINGSVI